jgi:hypothetical protein
LSHDLGTIARGLAETGISGVELRRVKTHRDARGELAAFESGDELGFELRRVFYIRANPVDAVRAEHAVSADELIVVLAGGVTVDLDNGVERQTLCLGDIGCALLVRAGVWLRLRNFEPATVLMVLASLSYGETRYFERPQPALLFRE